MTDDSVNRDTTAQGSDETAWTEPEATADRGEKAREWLAQLQSMIEQLATQAAPVVRQVGAKAAELAAVAGDKAGPVAARTAEVTGQAGQKLAVRARGLAAELRRDQASEGEPEAAAAPDATPESAEEPPAGAS